MAPISIDWEEVFAARDDGTDFCFTSTSLPTPHARAGAARGKQKGDTPGLRRVQTRFGGMQRDSGSVELGRRPRALLEPLKDADDSRHDARAAGLNVYDWRPEDAAGEHVSRKYCAKESRVQSGKKNYHQLETNSGRRPRPVGSGERKPIPVDLMYSSTPCSASFSGQQQSVHATEPEEVDNEKVCWRQNHSFNNFSKRRKEQHLDSSSVFIGKAEDVVLLDDEDTQLDEKVDSRIPNKQIEPTIYYPSRDDPEAVELSGSDITCLKPGVYLSSPVINYYIQYIKRTRLPKEDKFYIFNTYFYSKLEEALVRPNGFLKLRRWWKGVNIFQRAYIILPIHGMAHWSLIIICIPGKESDSGPIILHLDSLGMHSSTKIFGTVKRYLEEEWQHLKNNPPPDTSISESVWEDLPRNIHTQIVEVPQQNNAYDCGIFMLYYTERFVREAPERFTRDNLSMFSCSWFSSEDASELRPRIQALLLEEFESARLDYATSDAASSDVSDKEDIIESRELEVTPSDSRQMVVECEEFGYSGGKNNEGLKVAVTEEGSGESGGTGNSNLGTAEVPALEEAPTVSTRHDENGDSVLSEAATVSDNIKDEEDPLKAYFDSSKAEDEEELAIVSPDRWIVLDSCDSDSDVATTVDVPKRRATRQNCLII